MLKLFILISFLCTSCYLTSSSKTYMKKNCEDEAMEMFNKIQEERDYELTFINYGCRGNACALNFYREHKPGTLIFDNNNCVLKEEW